MKVLNEKEIKEAIIGKKIKDIKTGRYFDWMTVSEIVLDDGTRMDMAGNADEARIDFVWLPDGEQLVPEMEE